MAPRVSKASFGLDPDVTLLNHGSFGATPRVVLAAQARLRAEMEARPVPFMEEAPTRTRAVAEQLAPRLGARGDQLVLVDNATSGVSTVLRSLALRPGDRLMMTSHTYGAVRNAVRWVAARAQASVVDVHLPFPVAEPEEVVRAVEPHLAGCRLAVLDAVTSPTGLVMPYRELIAACRSHGVPVLLDAAHAPGLVPLDLATTGADWVTGNLHKWMFTPKSVAFLWAADGEARQVAPLVLSHLLDRGWPEAFDWVGTRDMTASLAVPEALAFVDALGADALRAHNDGLSAEAAERITRRWKVEIPSPASMRAAMATLPLPGDPPAEAARPLQEALRAQGIEVVVLPFEGRAWLRISAQVYNELDEYDRLARTVLELLA